MIIFKREDAGFIKRINSMIWSTDVEFDVVDVFYQIFNLVIERVPINIKY